MTDVTGLRFEDGSTLECDMVVVAAGIRPNVELAVRAGLRVERGIVVGDDLACPGVDGRLRDRRVRRASRPRLRAGRAAVGAGAGPRRSPDRQKPAARCTSGRRPSTKLKVAGVDLAVMGDKDAGRGRRRGRQLRRAVARHLQEADRPQRPAGRRDRHRRRRRSCPSLLQAFSRSDGRSRTNRAELLFRAMAAAAAVDADRYPTTALICDCNGVTKAQIIEAVLGGARSLRRGLRRDARVHRLRLVPARSRRRSSSSPARGWPCRRCWPQATAPVDECRGTRAGRRADVVVTLNKIERYKSEKDGLDIVRRRAAARAGRLAGDRRRRSRAAEVGGRVLPPPDARPLHDARAHLERPDQRRAAPHARGDQRASSAPVSSTSRRGSRFSCAASRSSTCPRSGGGSKRSGSSRCRPAWTTSATSSAVPPPA